MRRKALVGFGFFVAGALIGSVWLDFGDLLSDARRWLAAAAAVFAVAVLGRRFLARLEPYASKLAKTSRDLVVALEKHGDRLERVATLPERLDTPLERLGTSLERLGEEVGTLARRLDRNSELLEGLAMELVEAGQKQGMEPAGPEPSSGRGGGDSPSRPDLEQELMVAWRRYRDGGDGHFNAKGFKAELASAGIDVDVRGLDGQGGHAVLVVDDPWASDRSFFVVPDFNKSPKSAEHWFKDESSRRLGGRSDELRRLGRGRWSKNGPEVVERGSVA